MGTSAWPCWKPVRNRWSFRVISLFSLSFSLNGNWDLCRQIIEYEAFLAGGWAGKEGKGVGKSFGEKIITKPVENKASEEKMVFLPTNLELTYLSYSLTFRDAPQMGGVGSIITPSWCAWRSPTSCIFPEYSQKETLRGESTYNKEWFWLLRHNVYSENTSMRVLPAWPQGQGCGGGMCQHTSCALELACKRCLENLLLK